MPEIHPITLTAEQAVRLFRDGQIDITPLVIAELNRLMEFLQQNYDVIPKEKGPDQEIQELDRMWNLPDDEN